MPVVVVTDSSACLSPELIDRFGIRVVPLHLLSDGRDLRDGIDPVPDDLSGVTTSGASPGDRPWAVSTSACVTMPSFSNDISRP